MTEHQPAAIVFDLGNVLININFDHAAEHWAHAAGLAAPEVRGRFGPDEQLFAHECGLISDDTFFEHLDTRLQTAIGSHQISIGWNLIFDSLIEPIVDLLPKLASRFPLYVFSNTNAAHTPVWRERYGAQLEPHFQHVYLSHEIGRRKPDESAFTWLAEDIGINPSQLLFLDDSAANVAGAQNAGWQAWHVSDAQDTAARLTDL